MRSLDSYLDAYGESHRNPLNQKIHFVCVPVIVFATLALFWCLPLGHWFGLAQPLAYWVNGGTVLGLLSGVFYLMLSMRAIAVMIGFFALSVAAILALEASPLPLLWTALVIWVVAWAGQFYGHKVEGAKPSFAEDILFLLIGPLFVVDEITGGFFGRRAAQ